VRAPSLSGSIKGDKFPTPCDTIDGCRFLRNLREMCIKSGAVKVITAYIADGHWNLLMYGGLNGLHCGYQNADPMVARIEVINRVS
jgi:hypothetical protein